MQRSAPCSHRPSESGAARCGQRSSSAARRPPGPCKRTSGWPSTVTASRPSGGRSKSQPATYQLLSGWRPPSARVKTAFILSPLAKTLEIELLVDLQPVLAAISLVVVDEPPDVERLHELAVLVVEL